MLGLEKSLSLPPVKQLLNLSRRHIVPHLLTINDAVKKSSSDWIVGEHYSLADLTISCLLLRLEETGWLHKISQQADIADLLSYYRKLKQRTSWAEAIEASHHPIIVRATQKLEEETRKKPALGNLLYQL